MASMSIAKKFAPLLDALGAKDLKSGAIYESFERLPAAELEGCSLSLAAVSTALAGAELGVVAVAQCGRAEVAVLTAASGDAGGSTTSPQCWRWWKGDVAASGMRMFDGDGVQCFASSVTAKDVGEWLSGVVGVPLGELLFPLVYATDAAGCTAPKNVDAASAPAQAIQFVRVLADGAVQHLAVGKSARGNVAVAELPTSSDVGIRDVVGGVCLIADGNAEPLYLAHLLSMVRSCTSVDASANPASSSSPSAIVTSRLPWKHVATVASVRERMDRAYRAALQDDIGPDDVPEVVGGVLRDGKAASAPAAEAVRQRPLRRSVLSTRTGCYEDLASSSGDSSASTGSSTSASAGSDQSSDVVIVSSGEASSGYVEGDAEGASFEHVHEVLMETSTLLAAALSDDGVVDIARQQGSTYAGVGLSVDACVLLELVRSFLDAIPRASFSTPAGAPDDEAARWSARGSARARWLQYCLSPTYILRGLCRGRAGTAPAAWAVHRPPMGVVLNAVDDATDEYIVLCFCAACTEVLEVRQRMFSVTDFIAHVHARAFPRGDGCAAGECACRRIAGYVDVFVPLEGERRFVWRPLWRWARLEQVWQAEGMQDVEYEWDDLHVGLQPRTPAHNDDVAPP